MAALVLVATLGSLLAPGHGLAAVPEDPPAEVELAPEVGEQRLVGARVGTRAQELLSRAEQLQRREWMRSGPSSERDLRALFVESPHVQERVRSRCSGNSTTDCAWRQEDSLMCEALELAGLRGQLGNWTVLEQAALSAVASSWVYGVDPATRGLLLARWPPGAQQAPERVEEERRLPYRALEASLLRSPHLRRRAGEACDGLAEVRPGCSQAAAKALLCQALGQASSVLVGLRELGARLEEAVVLTGPAAAAVGSDVLERLDARTQQLLRRSSGFSMQQWLQSGSLPWRAFKTKFVSNDAAMREARKSCSSLGDHECVLRVVDPLLCDRLLGSPGLATQQMERGALAVLGASRDRAVEDEQFGALQEVSREEYLQAAAGRAARIAGESRQELAALYSPRGPEDQEAAAVDYQARSMLIAKWPETRRAPPPEAALDGMQRRLQATDDFQSLVGYTCEEVGEVVRPGCWATAPRPLFCEALGQAAAAEFGAAGLLQVMGLGA